MKMRGFLPAVCAAAFGLWMTAAAEPVQDPDYSDVVVLYSEDPKTVSADPLESVINDARAAAGAPAVTWSESLTKSAAMYVSEAENMARIEPAFSGAYSKTVIRGKADLNTMICSILLSEQQNKNLVCPAYSEFGYASNEDETVWVLLLAEALPIETTEPQSAQ